MSRLDHETPAVPFNPRRTDDPAFRIQMQAENRAEKNGLDPKVAGRKAMALRKLMISIGIEPDSERILRVTCGEYQRLTIV